MKPHLIACQCGAVSATEAAFVQMSEAKRRVFLKRRDNCRTCHKDRLFRQTAAAHRNKTGPSDT